VVVAKSFARIFYRNACNIGLAVLVCENAANVFTEGETLSVDVDSGELAGGREGKRAVAEPVPEFMRKMLLAGGLVAYTRKRCLSRSEKGKPCKRDTTSL
jgi:3-isopropylmalate/(R)-2-methylmalate dehydratase small subunit